MSLIHKVDLARTAEMHQTDYLDQKALSTLLPVSSEKFQRQITAEHPRYACGVKLHLHRLECIFFIYIRVCER